MEKKQTAMPTIAGILLIVSGGFKLLGFFALLAASFFVALPSTFPGVGWLVVLLLFLLWMAIIGIAIAGGISSLQRKRWNLALAGSIVSILPFSPLGIAATILVAISKNDFEGV